MRQRWWKVHQFFCSAFDLITEMIETQILDDKSDVSNILLQYEEKIC